LPFFVANWNPKPDNIGFIAETLNIGLDSLIFIDDNPMERDLVSKALPAVKVPEMPEDISDYISTLEASNLFETTTYSDADRKRAEMYQVESSRKAEMKSYVNLDDYLASLNMKVECQRFNNFHLPRITQLLLRSNQFNLRTQRFSESDCNGFMTNSENYYPIFINLSDKFGDYGLVSVICTKILDDELFISEWVMSCRVLKRGVENYTMNHLVDFCRKRGLKKIRGEYIQSSKNSMVENFYQQFGYVPTPGKENNYTWMLTVENYEPNSHHLVSKVGLEKHFDAKEVSK